jgi:signal transduction histidine kinase/ligand-binding sensor domain-containing protein
MISRLLLTCSLFTSSLLSAQDFSFINYGFSQGLHHSQVIDITQDTYGNLWVLPLTSKLLYRFDGRHFKKVPVQIEGVFQDFKLHFISADKQQNIWILTSIGLTRFDGRRFHFISSDKPLKVSRRSSLFVDSKSVVWVIDDDGNVFSCVDNALVSFDPVEAMKGTPVGVTEFNGEPLIFTNQSELISLATRQPMSLSWLGSDDRVRFIGADGDNCLVITEDKVIHYNNVTERKKVFNLGKDRPRMQQVLLNNDNVIMLSFGSISVITEDGIKPVNPRPDFDNKFVRRIFKDRSNSIWLATDSKGIFQLAKQQAVNIPIPGDDIVVTVYPKDDNKLLAGTYRMGLVEIDGTKVKDLQLEALREKIVMTAVKGPGNTVLLGTQQNGAYALAPGNKLKKLDLGAGNPTFVLPISNHRKDYWLGSSYGLHHLSGNLAHLGSYSYSQLGATSIFNVIYPLDSTLLIGSSGEGLFSFDPAKAQMKKIQGFESESILYTIKEDKEHHLWIGGEFPQILVLDRRLKRVASIDLGKYCSNVLTFEFINENQLLVGSNDGIFTVSLGDGHKVFAVRRLGLADGYKGGEVCMASMVRVKDKIWFGTADGVYSYSIENNITNNVIPYTYINDVRLFNQETDWEKYSDKISGLYALPEALELDHRNNNLTFSFYANDFHDNEDLQFHYWLEGSDTSWSDFSSAENIAYSSLPAGKYNFKVQSKDGFNVGNIATFPFVVLPAFWETNTFYMLAGLTVGIGIFVLIRIATHLRIKRFQLKEQIRATESAKLRRQMAMDFHDEMGNKLASVLAYSSSLKLVSSNKESHELFDYFEKNAAAIYYGTKDFIWSIDVDSNNLREVITYLRDFGVNFFEKHGIEFLVENDILNDNFDKLLPDGYNRQLVLMFKEAMTNILKHAKASKVYFDVTALNGGYRITLEDDGIGMQAGKGKGLKSMADRADKISAHLVIEPRQPQGTSVALQFKL